MPNVYPTPELLAPAGGPEALRAALAAGADAVYFGLPQLNARRGAANFAPAELPAIIAEIHAARARAYLTLNIDVTQRELGQAVRHLELARRSGVDAVLVRDPSLLALMPLYPELEFHFSTQAGIASSAGMQAARLLGIRRVVLARELTLTEVQAAAAVPGVETELFVQGALCFCVSGRCLLSSWVGGRSGNRGTCTSPCRVLWKTAAGDAGRPMSMWDLCLLERLPDLVQAGVRSFKIEGRLKKPEWVAHAVALYRRVLAGAPVGEAERTAAAWLGEYTGRRLTSGFLDGQRQAMTGEAGRPGVADVEPRAAAGSDCPAPEDAEASPKASLRIARDDRGGLVWQCQRGSWEWQWRMPPQVVHNVDRSLSLAEAADRFCRELSPPLTAATVSLFDPEFRIPRRIVNTVLDACQAELRRREKPVDGTVRVELPAAVRATLEPLAPAAANRHGLDELPDTVRLVASQAERFHQHHPRVHLVVEQATPAVLGPLRKLVGRHVTVALPTVLYEADLPAAQALIAACAWEELAVEVNSWDGWYLARQGGVRMIAGPGLMVLNALAAAHLVHLGCRVVTVSLEADREQLEALCSAASVPLCLCVFGRPPLMQTRVDLSAAVREGQILEDARGARLQLWREGSVSVLRPVEPFNLCGLRNDRIRAAQLMADLVGSPDPLADWQKLCSSSPNRLHFNYDRSLR